MKFPRAIEVATFFQFHLFRDKKKVFSNEMNLHNCVFDRRKLTFHIVI